MNDRPDATTKMDILAQIFVVDEMMKDLTKEAESIGIRAQDVQRSDGSRPIVPLMQIRSNLVLAEALMKTKGV